MKDWEQVWDNLVESARNVECRSSDLGDEAVESVLAEARSRRPVLAKRAETQLAAALSIASVAAALVVMVWCWGSLEVFADKPPLVIEDLVILELGR